MSNVALSKSHSAPVNSSSISSISVTLPCLMSCLSWRILYVALQTSNPGSRSWSIEPTCLRISIRSSGIGSSFCMHDIMVFCASINNILTPAGVRNCPAPLRRARAAAPLRCFCQDSMPRARDPPIISKRPSNITDSIVVSLTASPGSRRASLVNRRALP
ncbi:hypothetical protein VM1G_00213 [Cytospora mali]|uniref:Uncharacterized protein n=1 Tax=Cytospora mali TaxID=578113 RepID=A0A194VKF3_CYTMA|nr:hypothetical protein VM1G_00213 [Valsa mali]